MSSQGAATLVVEDGIGVVQLANLERMNAIDLAMARDLVSISEQLIARRDISALLLRGAGERAFTTGLDIRSISAAADQVEAAREIDRCIEQFAAVVRRVPYPTVSMIHGVCYGIGVNLATSTLFRFADSALQLSMPAVRNRALYPVESIKRLRRLIGSAHALRLIISGLVLDADECRRIGLIDGHFEMAELHCRTREFCAGMAQENSVLVQGYLNVIRGLEANDRSDADASWSAASHRLASLSGQIGAGVSGDDDPRH